MRWLELIKLLLTVLPIIIGEIKKDPDCPGGICDQTAEDVQSLAAELNQPGAQGLIEFVKCLDIKRFLAAVNELVAVIRDAIGSCPPAE